MISPPSVPMGRDPPTAKWLAEHWIVDETYHGLDGLLGEPADDWHE